MILEEIAGVKPGDPIPLQVDFTRNLSPEELDFTVCSFSRMGYTVIHESKASDHRMIHVRANRTPKSNG